MKRILIYGLLFALLAVFVAGFSSITAQGAARAAATPESTAPAQATAPLRTIKVSGNAEVMVPPDEVVLTLGVESWDFKLDQAKAKNDQIVQDVLAATKTFDIPATEVQTDYLNIEPSFDNYEHNKVSGYYVRRNVVVKLKDLAKFEDLLSAALVAGANYVHGVDFRTTDLRKYRDQARDLALQAAQEKAQAMAGKLGQQIGQPISIEETSNNWWFPYSSWWGYGSTGNMSQNVVQNAPSSSSSGAGSFDQSLAPGQIAVNATVEVEFELK